MVAGKAELITKVGNAAARQLLQRHHTDCIVQSSTRMLHMQRSMCAGGCAAPCNFAGDLVFGTSAMLLFTLPTGAVWTCALVLCVQVRSKANHLGGSIDPHAAFLLQRGIKTLALRVERQNSNAAMLAAALEKHPQARQSHHMHSL